MKSNQTLTQAVPTLFCSIFRFGRNESIGGATAYYVSNDLCGFDRAVVDANLTEVASMSRILILLFHLMIAFSLLAAVIISLWIFRPLTT